MGEIWKASAIEAETRKVVQLISERFWSRRQVSEGSGVESGFLIIDHWSRFAQTGSTNIGRSGRTTGERRPTDSASVRPSCTLLEYLNLSRGQ